ncbi:MAG: hypothetical protein WBO12_13345, partial [Xanthobacteraceae bacterium]
LVLPKPPPGWELILRKKSESAKVNEEQVDDPNAEDEVSSEELDPDDEPKGSAMKPVPGWRWVHYPEFHCWYPIRYSLETGRDIDPDRYKPTI